MEASRGGTVAIDPVVADVKRASRADAEPLQRQREDGGIGLRDACLGGGHDGAEATAKVQALELVTQRAVPVRNHAEREAATGEEAKSLAGARDDSELECAHECRRELRRVELGVQLVEEDRRTCAPKLDERRLVTSLLRARDVVRNLARERCPDLLGRTLDAALAQRGGQGWTRVDELDQGSVRVDRDGVQAGRAQTLTRAHVAADDSEMAERFFTLEEANAALADVRPLTERMVERRRALDEAQRRHATAMTQIAGNGGDLSPGELAELQAAVEHEAGEIARCIEQINGLGAQVKGVEDGLVDFPALRGGQVVLLCWRLGEDEIGFWHGPEDGFAGRRPLPL